MDSYLGSPKGHEDENLKDFVVVRDKQKEIYDKVLHVSLNEKDYSKLTSTQTLNRMVHKHRY